MRMALPDSQRHQMPAAFAHFIPRLRRDVLSAKTPLERFLVAEYAWFEKWESRFPELGGKWTQWKIIGDGYSLAVYRWP